MPILRRKDIQMANGFYIQPSYFAVIDGLPDKDRAAMWTALTRFAFRGEEPNLRGALKNYFELIRPTIEATKRRSETNTANGQRGGRPQGNKEPFDFHGADREKNQSVFSDENQSVFSDENQSVFPDENQSVFPDENPNLSDKGQGIKDEGQGIKDEGYSPSPLPSPVSASEPSAAKEGGGETLSGKNACLFLDFWDAYPRHEGKASAEVAWNTLRPDAELAKRIISAVKTQSRSVQWRKENGRFVPKAEKWIKMRGWEDSENEAKKAQDRPLSPGELAAIKDLFGKERFA